MKTAIVILLVGTACAQVPIKPNELACGAATLKLSMPQAGAVQALKENGYTLADPGKGGAVVGGLNLSQLTGQCVGPSLAGHSVCRTAL